MSQSVSVSVSVVVASRGRPADLRRCLTGLRQLYHRSFEIVVVADSPSLAGLEPDSAQKLVAFDAPNLSAARNLGIGAAGGEIVAFIDDDAVAEPTWLDRLAAPFAEAGVAAAGGYVLGRGGFALQWGAMCLDAQGRSHPLDVEGDAAQVFSTAPGERAIRTHGTNMAVRRSVFEEIGGFDEACHWYHDDADINMRLARAGHLTALVPLARVHHATAASERRRGDRTPLSLYDVGASTAVFHRKYLAERDWAAGREGLAEDRRRRLEAMLIDGRIEPRNFESLAKSLLEGYDEGLLRRSAPGVVGPPPAFTPRPASGAPRHLILKGGLLELRELRSTARDAVSDHAVATIIALDPTPRPHRLRFTDGGWWEQTGGRFGRSRRPGPRFVRIGLRERLAAEAAAAAEHRSPSIVA